MTRSQRLGGFAAQPYDSTSNVCIGPPRLWPRLGSTQDLQRRPASKHLPALDKPRPNKSASLGNDWHAVVFRQFRPQPQFAFPHSKRISWLGSRH